MRLAHLAALAALVVGCSTAEPMPAAERPGPSTSTRPMRITIQTGAGTRTFSATLADNPTARAFADRLPLTLAMAELHGNEKHVDLPNGLPMAPSNPGTIETGDLMLYGARTVVLFYETFRTTYSYTRLGRVDDPTGLAAVVGREGVTATYELE
ncbi:MAG TPA: cyclophilin-like fold protein [Rhodothermales bacterium]|nr:cyclophilin-like fold protein [Rhodothermales bacterium]